MCLRDRVSGAPECGISSFYFALAVAGWHPPVKKGKGLGDKLVYTKNAERYVYISNARKSSGGF